MLTAEQLTGWNDYYSREPWGFPISDLQNAMVMQITANVAGAKLDVEDFMLADALRDGPDNEDGTPSENALLRKLEKMLPPKPPPGPPAEEE